jgi:glycosyltransferase involved in cell wall biosynthesis
VHIVPQQPAADRVIFYPEIIAFGGAERVLLALSRHLHRHSLGHQLALYYLSVDLQAHANWPVPVRELRPSRNPLRKARSLQRHLSVQQEAGCGTALLVGIQAALHAGILGTRDYVLMILDTPSLLPPVRRPTRMGWLAEGCRRIVNRPVLRRGMRRAAAVVATSQYMADEIKRLYGVESVIARQGGLSAQAMGVNRSAGQGRCLRLLSVSRLERNKRIDWILQALSRPEFSLQPGVVGPSWHLDVVGDGSERWKLEAQTRVLGLADRVTFHGYVPDARLEELYSGASLFLMPAVQGYGLPALEALGRRIPVVLHRDSGVSEILAGTPWVELVNGDIECLAGGLGRLLGRLRSGQLAAHPLPVFPSESDWADQICRLCGWR